MKLVLAASLFLILNACASKQEEPKSEAAVATNTTEKNKDLIQRVYSDMANKRNYALIDSFFAPNMFDHGALKVSSRVGRVLRKPSQSFSVCSLPLK